MEVFEVPNFSKDKKRLIAYDNDSGENTNADVQRLFLPQRDLIGKPVGGDGPLVPVIEDMDELTRFGQFNSNKVKRDRSKPRPSPSTKRDYR